MDDHRRIMVMERKPTASGVNKPQYVVGGEVYPANLLELAAVNVVWLLLLLAPILLIYVLVRHGVRLPSVIRRISRIITRDIV